jgi:hypothetical protein
VIEIDELASYDDEDRNGDPVDEDVRRLKFRLLGPLGQAHNINAYIRKSLGRIAEFRSYA